VQNLRDFSRVDTTQGFRLFDVHRAIETTLGIVRSLTGSAVRFATYFDELPLVECNPTELNQVLMNILVNATQAVDQNGSVEIHTGRGPHHVWIEIKDDGCGIEEHVLPRIFEPFFTTKDVGRGTGLGLSISYGIIRKHGGDITVRSRIGAGTVFLITLPVKQAGATQGSSE
jgi:signal transduction histidine kinase